MVGLIGCGCCGGGGGGGPTVPGGCAVCEATYNGIGTDSTAYSDGFDTADPRWEFLMPTWQGGGVPPAPNVVTDYLRSSHLHAFKDSFFTYLDPWFGATGVRAIPRSPLPNAANGRQPWLRVRRRANMYFPASQPRTYRIAVDVNYPIDTLPNIPVQYSPMTGAALRLQVGAQESPPSNEFFSFYVAAQGLNVASDNHPSATLSVGCKQISPEPSRPFWTPTFAASTTVPFGMVSLALDLHYNPQSNTGTTKYYVNGSLIYTDNHNSPQFPSTTGTDCVSFCNVKIDLDAIEPWKNQLSPATGPPVIWYWNGFAWLRGGYAMTDPPPVQAAVTWSLANNPEDKLWFDNYSFSYT